MSVVGLELGGAGIWVHSPKLLGYILNLSCHSFLLCTNERWEGRNVQGFQLLLEVIILTITRGNFQQASQIV